MKKDWAPGAGDVIWIEFDPQVGREQSGHRPAVVLSDMTYNGLIGLLLCVPLTTRVKGYPFEVSIAGERPGVALADHIKSFDWRARNARLKGKVTAAELEAIRLRARQVLG
ncbi:MAG: endoribonuclease MazF [Sphingomicrobium sp.]|nr:endoribonuclease MazF [Sphingomonadales bacterium]